MTQELRITLIKSHIGRPECHRAVLRGLGLTKMNRTVSLSDTKEIQGMIRKVQHMVRVEK
jgi:large subunit ribosomal protein L30